MTRSQALPVWAAVILLSARMAAPGGAAPAGTASADTSPAPGSHLVISELGMSAVLHDTRHGGDPTSFDAAFGYLGRSGRRTMVGGEVGITLRNSDVNYAVRPRVRQELGNDWCLNLAAGPIVGGSVDSSPIDGPGLSVAAGLDYRGYVGLRLELQSFDYRGDLYTTGSDAATTHVNSMLLGVRLGRKPGCMSLIGAAVIAAVMAGDGSGLGY